MIGISTLTQNTAGDLVIHEKYSSQLNDIQARITRTKTLDGGVYINHSGVSDGDRTLRIIADMSESDYEKLINIHKTETFINISMTCGVYLAVISNIRKQYPDTVITILIESKET